MPTNHDRHRVLVAIGTRPEAIKLAPVVHALHATAWADVRVLATAQHRELADSVLAFFGIAPDLDLDLMRPDQTLTDLTGRGLAAVDGALAAEQPAFVLAQGDTTTVLVTALASFYRGVPFGHVEAGLRTGDLRAPFPEEMNRSVVGRIADLHFAPTEVGRAALLREAVPAEHIHVTGNTVIDALLWATDQELPKDYDAGPPLILMTAHRRESFGAPFEAICAAVRRIVDEREVRVLYPVHPNPNVRRTVHAALGDHPRITLTEPLDYPHFVAAMRAAHLLLTDSGGVQEEAPSLDKPVLVLRETTERPEGVACGASELVGVDTDRICAAVFRLLDSSEDYARMAAAENPYGDGKASARIVDAVRQALA